MLARVTITDWELGGARRSVELRLVSETMTMREFLRRRLVEARADEPADRQAHGLLEAWCVAAGATEQVLNGGPRNFGPTSRSWADGDNSLDRRLRDVETAFAARGFVALFDGSQIGDLDQLVTVRDDSKATFIRLVPLVGG